METIDLIIRNIKLLMSAREIKNPTRLSALMEEAGYPYSQKYFEKNMRTRIAINYVCAYIVRNATKRNQTEQEGKSMSARYLRPGAYLVSYQGAALTVISRNPCDALAIAARIFGIGSIINEVA